MLTLIFFLLLLLLFILSYFSLFSSLILSDLLVLAIGNSLILAKEGWWFWF